MVTQQQAHVGVFDTTLQKTHEWLEAMAEYGNFIDHEQAYSAMRAALHSLRDRLTVDEATQLAAQLPMLVRGFYYEGWDPSRAPNRERTLDQFLDSVRESLRRNTTINPEQAVRATFAVLIDKISAGEAQQVKEMLPKEVQALWPEGV